MKEKIYQLIDSYVGMWNADKWVLSRRIETLMCYREVRAYFIAVAEHDGKFTWFGLREEILEEFSGEYLPGAIMEAIEKVREEYLKKEK